MKNKRIIMLSVILLITILMIIGVSYAYYLTKITKKTNEKSISVKSSNLVITYKDGNSLLKIDSLDFGETTEVKTFTVTNDGDDVVRDYAVFFENVENELNRPEDLEYSLICRVYNTDEYENSSDANTIDSCNSITPTKKEIFPTGNGKTLMVIDDISVGLTHEYKLTITYKESNEDQSMDLGKTISAKVNIDSNVKDFIFSNVLLKSGEIALEGNDPLRTHLTNVETSVASSINNVNERVLAENPDDYGTSYYYRGNINDNYVNFSGKCWRIVRILGDGSIKLILEDKDTTCDSSSYTGNWNVGNSNYGYTNMYVRTSSGQLSSNKKNLINYEGGALYQTNKETSLKTVLNNWYNSYVTDKAKVKKENWCLGDKETVYNSSGTLLSDNINDLFNSNSTFYYKLYTRIYRGIKPTLRCADGGVYEDYVGALTADEATFAGGKVFTANANGFYLVNTYQKNAGLWFWLYGPFYNTVVASVYSETNPYVLQINSSGNVSNMNINKNDGASRPVIVLKPNTIISGGNGTKLSPYII